MPRSKASWRWASSPRASATAAPESSDTAPVSPASLSSAKARESRRSPVASARPRPEVAATVGRPRRNGASSSTSSWTSVAMWTSSIAVAARTAASPPASPAQSRTSIGRSRLPPAARVAPASSPRGPPQPSIASRSRSSTSPRRTGSQRWEASRTAVTGGGTADPGMFLDRPCALGAAVDRDDAAGQHRVADRLEPGPVHLLGQAVRRGEAADRLGQVAVGLGLVGEGAEQRHDAVEPEREEGRERRPRRLGDLEDDQPPAPLQHPRHLAQTAVEVGEVAGAEGDRDRVEALPVVGQLERVGPLEADPGDASVGGLL